MINDELEHLLAPTINDMGYDLWGCEHISQGKHSLLRIYIDKTEGITIDDCEAVSHQISALLNVEEPIQGNYRLEVSSPGIPRPLFKSYQYNRYIGQEVQVRTIKPVDGKRKLMGRIVSVSEHALVLSIDNKDLELLFSNIAKANLTV